MAGGESYLTDPLGRGDGAFLGAFGRGFEPDREMTPYEKTQRAKRDRQVAEKKARDAGASPYQIVQAGKAARRGQPLPTDPIDDIIIQSALGDLVRRYREQEVADKIARQDVEDRFGKLYMQPDPEGAASDARAKVLRDAANAGLYGGVQTVVDPRILQDALAIMAGGDIPMANTDFDGLAAQIATGAGAVGAGPVTGDALALRAVDESKRSVDEASRDLQFRAAVAEQARLDAAAAEQNRRDIDALAEQMAGVAASKEAQKEGKFQDPQDAVDFLRRTHQWSAAPDLALKLLDNPAVYSLLSPGERTAMQIQADRLLLEAALAGPLGVQAQSLLGTVDAYLEDPENPATLAATYKAINDVPNLPEVLNELGFEKSEKPEDMTPQDWFRFELAVEAGLDPKVWKALADETE